MAGKGVRDLADQLAKMVYEHRYEGGGKRLLSQTRGALESAKVPFTGEQVSGMDVLEAAMTPSASTASVPAALAVKAAKLGGLERTVLNVYNKLADLEDRFPGITNATRKAMSSAWDNSMKERWMRIIFSNEKDARETRAAARSKPQ